MRTTLTIDDDVAAVLQRRLRTGDTSLKDLVNDALRRGLQDMNAPPKRRQQFRTDVVALGRVRLPSLDNIGEALAIAEGEGFK